MRHLLLICALSSLAFSQATTTKLPQNIAAEAFIPNLPAQIIGPDDMVLLSVYDSPEFTRTVRVGSDGDIRIPMLKQRVRAEGLLPAQLEVAVAKALTDEKLLIDPFVTVTVIEYHSRPISVVGAVKKPITFQAIGPMTLLEALARAEGLTDLAEGQILVSHPSAGNHNALVQRIPVKSLIDNADPEYNIKLKGGEEIRVPEAPRITVAGNVRKPGSFPVKDASELTVMKAIALGEGLSQFYGNTAYIYRVDDSKGTKNEIEIPLKKILDRKSPDIPLQARDILYIPDSTGKRSWDKILSIGGATASGVAIFH
ncbi:MAG: polysaccharide export protein [Bryobacterales bacterium]|nr:polysaccharide export protein [Bryobacterales bacterium]